MPILPANIPAVQNGISVRVVEAVGVHGLPHSAHDLHLFDIKDLPQQVTTLVPGDDNPEPSDTTAGRGSTAGTGTQGEAGTGGTAPAAAPSEPSDNQDQEEEAPAASTVVPDDQDEEENLARPASPAPRTPPNLRSNVPLSAFRPIEPEPIEIGGTEGTQTSTPTVAPTPVAMERGDRELRGLEIDKTSTFKPARTRDDTIVTRQQTKPPVTR